MHLREGYFQSRLRHLQTLALVSNTLLGVSQLALTASKLIRLLRSTELIRKQDYIVAVVCSSASIT